jgi:aminoglycoside phosphotransferase (APT) family kinase protein
VSTAFRSIRREPSPFARRARAEVVTVVLADGTVQRRFVKWLAPDAHPDKRRREREPLVFRRLLEPGHIARRLPVPRCYGAYRDAVSHEHVLVLEHVDGLPLKYHGLERWPTAARELARLHASFAAAEATLRRCDFLLRLDGDYFGAWAARAAAVVEQRAPALGARVRRALRDHDAIAALLAAQPPTLVHNDLAPKNVVVGAAGEPPRICFVDWEMAGVGCGLLDLAHLLHGLEGGERERVASAYWSELARADPAAVATDDRERVLAACDLQNAIFRLAHVTAWGLDEAAVAERVDELERLRAAAPIR